ncbi:MAG: polysaccharide biosynthesis/export family protein [Candidatus Omnitrophota bacterium]
MKIFTYLFLGIIVLYSLTYFLPISVFAQAEQKPSQVIAKGDKLTIKVLEQEDLNGAYTVSSEGAIEFPLINERIPAVGLTYDELAQKIKEKLEEKYFYKATVIVSAFTGEEIRTNNASSVGGVIYVYGMVGNPGAINIPEGEVLTVSKVLIRCGGFKDFANKGRIKLIRKSQATGKAQITYLNMVDIIDKGKVEKDIVVRDGDLIVVPEKFFNF